MAILRSLLVNIGLNSANYRTELTRTQRSTNTSFTSMAKSVVGFSAAAASALSASAAASASMVRDQSNMARLSNMTVQEYSAMSFAAKQYGMDTESIADISKDAIEKVGEYINAGSGGLQDFADAIGMNAKQTLAWAKATQNMSGTEIFQKMVTEMEAAGLSSAQMSNALESMGSDVTKLIPLFSDNGAELNRLTGRYNEFNEELSTDEIKRYRKAAEDMDLAMESISRTITKLVLPAVKGVQEALKVFESFGENQKIDDLSKKLEVTSKVIEETKARIADGTGWFYDEEDLSADQKTLKTLRETYTRLHDEFFSLTIGSKGLLEDPKTPKTPKNKKIKTKYETEVSASSADQLKEKNRKEAESMAESLRLSAETLEEKYTREGLFLKDNLTDHEEYLTAKAILDDNYNTEINRDSVALKEKNNAEAEALAESLKISTETLEEKYSRESKLLEDNLADHEEYLLAKGLLDEEYANEVKRRQDETDATQRALTQGLLNYTTNMLSITTDMMEGAGQENTAMYKALFIAQKAAAIPSMIVATEKASVDALAVGGPYWGPALAASTKALGYASIGIAAGQAVAGVAHGGIDEIPGYGTDQTWLLQGGERVVSKEQNQDLKNYMNQPQGQQPQSGGIIIQVSGNIYGDEQTEKIMEDAASRGYKKMYDDARRNGAVSNQLRRG